MTSKMNFPEMTSRMVRVGKLDIHLAEIGSGFPVLMLHGGGPGASGVSNYSKNIQDIAQHFRVLIPDMPGWGKSTKGINRRDPFGFLANSMRGLLENIGVEQAHVIGNSLGGGCGLRMALDAPNLVASLTLMGPGGINTTRSLPTPGLRHLFNYYKDEGPSLEKMDKFIREYLIYDTSNLPMELVKERYEATLDPELRTVGQLQGPKGLIDPRKVDFTRDKRLQRCQTPTFVIWGTEDNVNRPSGGLSLQKRMPNCDLYLCSQTGHWVQWERAQEFNELTLAFIKRHTPAQ